MRTALFAAVAALLAFACAHDRDTSPPPTTVTGAPVNASPPSNTTPSVPPPSSEYQNGTVPDRTWGTGGVSQPGAGPSTAPTEDLMRDAGVPAPVERPTPGPDYVH
jgi:hypothetical protein